MNTNERSLRNESCSACRTERKNVVALVTLVETSHSTKISGRRGRLRPVPQLDRHAAGLQRGAHRPSHVDVGVALAAAQLAALGRQPALELGDDPVHRRRGPGPGPPAATGRGRSAAAWAAGSAVRSIRSRSSSRRRCCSNRRSWSRGTPSRRGSSSGSVRLRLGAQAERAADPLHVDAEHARALAACRTPRSPAAPGRAAPLRRRPAAPRRSAGAAPRGRDRARRCAAALRLRRSAGGPPRPRRRGRRSGRTRARTRAGPRATWRASPPAPP